MPNSIVADISVQRLIDTWNEAKKNADGWAAVKKQAEVDILAMHESTLQGFADSLKTTTFLTGSVGFTDPGSGDTLLKVTVGEELKLDQVEALTFLKIYPDMEGVMFKKEYKAVAPVILAQMLKGDAMATALDQACTLKAKKPSFSKA